MQLSSRLLFFAVLSLPSAALAQATATPAAAPPVRRDLSVRLDLGGTEPGTSKQAFEAVVAYRGVEPWELQAGYTYSDQIYYQSNRGFLTAYRFYDDGLSYGKADATLRRYDYPVAPGAIAPNPDSNSYEWVPRLELELSHRFTPMWRGALQYQLFPANFWHDTSSWTVNNKLSAEVELRPVPQVSLGARAAVLRDPDPDKTVIKGSTAVPCPDPAQTGCVAGATSVTYRFSSLLGGWAGAELWRLGLKLEYLPNRDLDNSYAWSILTTLDVRVTDRLDVRLQQVHDSYSSVSTFSGTTADIEMGVVRYAVSDALRVRAGYRYVDVPDHFDVPPTGGPVLVRRQTGTVIVGLELRPGL